MYKLVLHHHHEDENEDDSTDGGDGDDDDALLPRSQISIHCWVVVRTEELLGRCRM